MAFEAMRLIGDLQLGPLDVSTNKPKYYMEAINATQFTLTPGEIQYIERISRKRDTYGAPLTSIPNVTSADSFNVTNDEFRAEILALQIRGVHSANDIAQLAVVDESVVVNELDQWLPLAHDHLTADAVTTTGDTYTENTHFVVKRRTGQVKFLSGVGGAPTKGASINMSYTRSAHTYTKVTGGVKVPERFAILFDGINQATNKDCKLVIPRALVGPGGDLELLTEQVVSGQLQIRPELISGTNEPYDYREDD